jgi:integrase
MTIISAPAPGDWDFRAFAPIPFARFVQELLALYTPPLRARPTLTRMTHTMKNIGELIGPDGTTADFTPTLVGRLIASRPEGEASRTTHTILAQFRAACSYAKSQGYIRTSPFEFRKKWVRLGHPEGKKHHSMADIRRVLDLLEIEAARSEGWPQWRAYRLLALVSTFAYTGLRRNEGLLLRVDEVDLDHRMILLVDRKGRRLKTEGSGQPVPIPDALAPILADWIGRLARGCPHLFPGVTGKGPWTGGPPGHRPLDQIKAVGERAGVQGLTFLSLRHSFATHAESWGLSPAMLQRVLRHTLLATQTHYRHADADNMRAAVGRISFDPPVPPATEGGPATS